VSTVPTVSVSLRFLDKRLASQACTVQELPELTSLTTDSEGIVTFDVPVIEDLVTIVFASDGTTCSCRIGHIDPINTCSGVFQRLQNLGYIDADATSSPPDLELIRSALRNFKAAQPGATAADVAPADTGSTEAGPSTDSPDGTPPSDSIESAPDFDPTVRDSRAPVPESDGSTDDASSDPDSSANTSAISTDDAGLSDDGVLDDATAQMLVTAHGS
jgi:hypothetical protein